MAAINDLIAQIEDIALRERIAKEVDRLSKQKKFGLVFEEHLPECTPLYDIPVKAGALVAKKAGEVNDVYKVLCIEDNTAQCLHRESKETAEIALDDLVTVAEFGEPIYPYLKPIDTVCNAPDSDLCVAHADRGRQLSCPATVGIPVRRQGGLHLHRSALQYRRKGLEIQQ